MMKIMVDSRDEPMFKIIPWRVSIYKNHAKRTFNIIEALLNLDDDYFIEVNYETDKDHNDHIVYWLYHTPESMDDKNEIEGGE